MNLGIVGFFSRRIKRVSQLVMLAYHLKPLPIGISEEEASVLHCLAGNGADRYLT